MAFLTTERARELLSLNATDGRLYWKETGNLAAPNCDGNNFLIKIDGRRYGAFRVKVIWLGSEPELYNGGR